MITLQLHIKNQLGDNLAIKFCCGADKECILQPEEETVIEITEDVCMYFDGVKPAKAVTPFSLAMEHAGGEDKTLKLVCEQLGQLVGVCPPKHSDNNCPPIPCGDCWMNYFREKFREKASKAEGKPCGG